MNEVIVKKGQRTLNFVRVEENKFSVIDTRANKQSLYKIVSRKKLMKTITEMI